MKNRSRQNRFVRGIKKFLLSAFVVVSFSAYALEHRAAGGGDLATPAAVTLRAAATPTGAAPSAPAARLPATGASSAPAAAPTTGPDAATSPTAAPAAKSTATSPAAAAPAAAPTATPTSPAPAIANSGYKDGTYTGPAVDVRWGNVQVEATIQNGQISNVQFLQYPNDRRTSVRINSIAGPELQQEAVQAQSANVDIITGATLTSEGFQESLQAALNQAKSQNQL
jgi:uncharacterized protein with FMN-binding domain